MPPSPPAPPLPPPIPALPRAPPPPPPAPYYQLRSRDAELDSDPDCIPVSYRTCAGLVADYAREQGTANVLTFSVQPCEGTDVEVGCFVGCSYGSRHGGHYHAIFPDMEAEFNSSNPKRCKYSDQPLCACANKNPDAFIFPPPPPYVFAETFHGFPAYKVGETMRGGTEVPFTLETGQASALVKRLVNARTIDLSLRQSHRGVSCPGQDDGEQACARSCAGEHLTELRAFTVTGDYNTPPPPAAPPPYVAPHSPPPPNAPFNACSNTCRRTPTDEAGDERCHDGGKGSFLPNYCVFGTDCKHCGFRSNTRFMDPIDDDSCVDSNNGVCEDGGYGSAFVTDLYVRGKSTSKCGLGTDQYAVCHRTIPFYTLTHSNTPTLSNELLYRNPGTSYLLHSAPSLQKIQQTCSP